MNESLTSQALKRFQRNSVSYVLVGVLCALFFVLLSALSLIDVFAFVIAIPFFALPFLFASHISCYLMEVGEPIKIGSFFRYYFSFFRPQFRGSFRAIVSFLISLLVYFGLAVISYIVMFAVFKAHYGQTFIDATNNLLEQYLTGITYEELLNLLKENDGILLTFMSFVSALPLPASILTFVFLISYNSISLYYRANITSGAPSLLRLGIANAYRANRKVMLKDWLKLNWGLILLPIIGCACAGAICVFGTKTYTFLPAFVTVGAFALLVFFLPFYFPNMEVLYHRYEESFKEGNKKAIEIFLERIQNSIELSEEERKKLEESFNDDNEKKE